MSTSLPCSLQISSSTTPRTIGRRRELALRLALGAGRWRITRQLFAESLIVAAISGTIAWWITLHAVRVYAVARASRYQVLDYSIDVAVGAYVAALSLGAAVLLAAIGLYGVMSYVVARRSNEIGIRMAMGAERRDVVRMVLGETGCLVAAGIVAGTGLALAGGRFARSLLFQLSHTDPTTVASAIALLVMVGLMAGAVPARRASRVEPAIALRDE